MDVYAGGKIPKKELYTLVGPEKTSRVRVTGEIRRLGLVSSPHWASRRTVFQLSSCSCWADLPALLFLFLFVWPSPLLHTLPPMSVALPSRVHHICMFVGLTPGTISAT